MPVASPGMAAGDSFDAHPASTKNPVLQYRLLSILAACRSKTATGRKQWRNGILIDQDWKYSYLSKYGICHG